MAVNRIHQLPLPVPLRTSHIDFLTFESNMVKLDNDVFLSELTRMFQKGKSEGSVSVTMKRYDGRAKPEPREGRKPLPEPSEYSCLMRATWSSKKISTIIQQKDINKFQQVYCNLLKGNLDGLKKLKKTKNKAKATQ